MSLVNDMLRDLEQRGQARNISLGNETIQSVESTTERRLEKSFSGVGRLVIAGLLIGCLIFAWSAWQQESHVNVKVAPAPAPAPALPTDTVTAMNEGAGRELNLELVDWHKTDQGGVLVMMFDQPPQVQMINQTRDSIAIAMPNVRLDNTLPLPEKTVVREFNLMLDGDQLILDLQAARDARFELRKSTARQLEFVVSLIEPVVTPPFAVQKQKQPANSVPVTAELPSTTESVSEAVTKTIEPKTSAKVSDNRSSKKIDLVDPVPTKVRELAQDKKLILTDVQAVSKARKLLQQNKVTEAQSLLESQIKQVSNVPDSQALLASLYLAGGKVAQAVNVAKAGLETAPHHSGLKKVNARILLMDKDSEGAVALLENTPPAIKLDAEYHEILAAALQQQGRADDAVNVYYQLLKYDSGQARLWVGLGYSLELAARPAESRKAYESSLQVPGIEDNLKRYVTQRLSQLAER